MVSLWTVVGLAVAVLAVGATLWIGGARPGSAPGWQARCLACGRTRDAGEIGVTRVKAAGRKYILAVCTGCRRLRVVVIERSGVKS